MYRVKPLPREREEETKSLKEVKPLNTLDKPIGFKKSQNNYFKTHGFGLRVVSSAFHRFLILWLIFTIILGIIGTYLMIKYGITIVDYLLENREAIKTLLQN